MNNETTDGGAAIESPPLLGILFGPEIKVPDYTPEQAEMWIDHDCPTYTGIMAAVNGIAFKRYGCFIDRLSELEKKVCFDDAGRIGLAWFEMPNRCGGE
jgi:hypothetical protein